ncbi:MAG TPA: substrate-binding domain-containing protein [Ktedonobacteraceae bacterium]
MLRRFLSLASLVAVVALITGCSAITTTSSNKSASSSGGNSLPANCKTSQPTLGVALPNTVNPYYIAMRQSFLDNGPKAGFKVNMAIANDSDSTQLSQIDSFIQQGVCAVALNPVNSGPGAADVATLNHAGIPVFVVNIIISAATLKQQNASIVQYVGPDQVEGGTVMAQALLQAMGNSAKIVAGVVGDPNQIPTNERDQGFKDYLTSHDPNAKVLPTVNSQVDPNVSLQVTTDLIQGNPNMNVIFADTGPGVTGAIQAIKQLNKVGKISLYGFCAANTQLDTTLYRGCAAQEPAQYAQTMTQNIAQYIKGKKLSSQILQPVKVFSEGQMPGPGEVG